MKINIKELQNSPEKSINISFHEVIKELENDTPVLANLNITATNYGINIKGKVQTELKLICDRCLEEYSYFIDAEIEESFVNESIHPEEQKEYELSKGQFVEELKGREEIDITDFLYQSVVLEIPIKKICNEECEGAKEYKKLISEKMHEKIDERLEVFKSFSENNFIEDEENKN